MMRTPAAMMGWMFQCPHRNIRPCFAPRLIGTCRRCGELVMR